MCDALRLFGFECLKDTKRFLIFSRAAMSVGKTRERIRINQQRRKKKRGVNQQTLRKSWR